MAPFNRAPIIAVNSILPSSGNGYSSYELMQGGIDPEGDTIGSLVKNTFSHITENFRNNGFFSSDTLDFNNSAMLDYAFAQQGVKAANGRVYHDTGFYGMKPKAQASSFLACC